MGRRHSSKTSSCTLDRESSPASLYSGGSNSDGFGEVHGGKICPWSLELSIRIIFSRVVKSRPGMGMGPREEILFAEGSGIMGFVVVATPSVWCSDGLVLCRLQVDKICRKPHRLTSSSFPYVVCTSQGVARSLGSTVNILDFLISKESHQVSLRQHWRGNFAFNLGRLKRKERANASPRLRVKGNHCGKGMEQPFK